MESVQQKRLKTFVKETRMGANIQLYVNGSKKAFHCEQCYANVFTKFEGDKRYYCNGCPATYIGKP